MNYHKILIAVDDSPTAEKVASIGFQLAKQLNAEIALWSIGVLARHKKMHPICKVCATSSPPNFRSFIHLRNLFYS
ncbi:MAG: universal stress protein [Bacteroidia bacterium]